jgi:predicted metal-dependent hydrolase
MERLSDEAIAVLWEEAKHVVHIRRDPNARRLTLRIRPAKRDVLLSVPPSISRSRAINFLELNICWIHEKLSKLPPLVELVPGSIIPIRGVYYHIVHVPETRGTAWIDLVAEEGEPTLFVAGRVEHSKRRIKNLLTELARADLTKSVAHYCNQLGTALPRITLRDTSSRWGSCSINGDLSFCWRLIFAPPMVLDYLAAHEVAHLLESNHSEKFWRTVTRICGHVEEAERWLRDHGPHLHCYG